jgi:hypothetical protein
MGRFSGEAIALDGHHKIITAFFSKPQQPEMTWVKDIKVARYEDSLRKRMHREPNLSR